MTCESCEGAIVYARSRCRSCYLFFMRHKRDRTEDERVEWACRRFENDIYQRLVRDIILAAEGEIA